MVNKKKKVKSKGFLGGLVGMGGFAILAFALSAVGVETTPDELREIKAEADVLVLQADHIRNVFYPAVVAFIGALVGFVGNLYRKSRIRFRQGVPDGKSPWKSRGVMGNLAALVAAIGVFISAFTADIDTAKDLAEQGKLLAVKLDGILAIVVPAVVGIKGSLFGLLGRWQADNKISN